ncbi:restriction endonuclease subunit S [Acinetobacter radioresistens]|uniref:restriction endonuclease subunit S n=1 Tax=Acinetobacter TaxID=469 RepID=UPI001D175EBD
MVLALNRPVTNDQLKIAKLTKQDSPSILYQRVGKLEFKKNEIDSGFIFQIFQKDVKNYVLNSSIGSDQPFISTTHLYKHKLHIPSKPEQTKIASFLSAVDEKISQLTQKHELLSQYKQGMMQKLFSQEIRFKADDGGEFGEWEETSLHTFLCESLIKGSKGNKAKKLTVKLWGKGVIPKNEAFQGSENTQYYKRSAGQLIYGKLDFLNCAFGLIPEYLDGFESTIDAPAFDIDNKIVHPYFLINRFLQKDFYQKNGEEADGSRKAKRINQSVFLAMQIDLPSLEEQTKIANFLSAIDQKIEVVTQQIEQAKTWKKGLLQQMFV